MKFCVMITFSAILPISSLAWKTLVTFDYFHVVNYTCGQCVIYSIYTKGIAHLNSSSFLCFPGPLMCFLVNYRHLKDVKCRGLHGLVYKYCLRRFLCLIVIRSSLSVHACQIRRPGQPSG